MRKPLIGTAVVIVGAMIAETHALAVECVCLQVEMWPTGGGNSEYFAFRYNNNDPYCADDPASSDFFVAPSGTNPQTYCQNTSAPCQCCYLVAGAPAPPAPQPYTAPEPFASVPPTYVIPDPPDGRSWNRLKAQYVMFHLPNDPTQRFAKLFVMSIDNVDSIVCVGVQITELPANAKLARVESVQYPAVFSRRNATTGLVEQVAGASTAELTVGFIRYRVRVEPVAEQEP